MIFRYGICLSYIYAWPTMLGITTWLGRRIAEKFSSLYGTAIIRQHTNLTFYSSFEENCQQIVNYSLPPRRKPLKKYLQKIAPDEPMPPLRLLVVLSRGWGEGLFAEFKSHPENFTNIKILSIMTKTNFKKVAASWISW